jgi:hypothetical protein
VSGIGLKGTHLGSNPETACWASKGVISIEYKMRLMKKTRNSAVLVILLTFYTLEASSMGLFDFLKVCLFSEVNGVVTLEGKPVAGAELVRTAQLGDKIYTDKAVTDGAGVFHFEALIIRSSRKITSMGPLVPQEISISHNSISKQAWLSNKNNYDVLGETGSELYLMCELDADPINRELPNGAIMHGICILK